MRKPEKEGTLEKMHEKMFPRYLPGIGPGCCVKFPLTKGIIAVAVFAFIDTFNQAQFLIRTL